jgi:hypothetical protein
MNVETRLNTFSIKLFQNVPENPENYFTSHSDGSKILTSDKTLSHLHTPRLSQEALRHMLSGEKLRFQKEIDQLLSDYHNRFDHFTV